MSFGYNNDNLDETLSPWKKKVKDKISIVPTPYQRYLMEEGFIAIDTDGYRQNIIPFEYLKPVKCIFCGKSGHLDSGTMMHITPKHSECDTKCGNCHYTIGKWIRRKGDEVEWIYIPTQDTDIFRNKFCIDQKVKTVLRGLLT